MYDREIELEIPMKEVQYADSQSKGVIEILKETVEQIKSMNE